ncbi:MAG TPA: 2,3,4,5-tetrahydropyridine-2,6-dicarboxylate N-succinyltransferase [Candidatus Acidoferrales bacterium]|nr:2,3,4,5-tetrahydropyridine-2,6-dicarboxylate N-succinyltransferase [Candidatus Acidoferrales bacterium]
MSDLKERIERLFAAAGPAGDEHFAAFEELRRALDEGRVRAAEPGGDGAWRTNAWVKKGILLGFRIGRIVHSEAGALRFADKHTLPLRAAPPGARLVPGGSSLRDGCYIGKGVIAMPPCFVNIGAYVDDDTLIDSHALVGSCAQIGKRVHLSAGAQIGGVLEPVGSLPVIVEDDALVGGNSGVYEGAIVGRRAVLGAGTILTGSTPVYDLVLGAVYRREGDRPLRIPPGAVVVPGARAVVEGKGREWNLSLYTPVIVKYRDEKTSESIQLEHLLRPPEE